MRTKVGIAVDEQNANLLIDEQSQTLTKQQMQLRRACFKNARDVGVCLKNKLLVEQNQRLCSVQSTSQPILSEANCYELRKRCMSLSGQYLFLGHASKFDRQNLLSHDTFGMQLRNDYTINALTASPFCANKVTMVVDDENFAKQDLVTYDIERACQNSLPVKNNSLLSQQLFVPKAEVHYDNVDRLWMARNQNVFLWSGRSMCHTLSLEKDKEIKSFDVCDNTLAAHCDDKTLLVYDIRRTSEPMRKIEKVLSFDIDTSQLVLRRRVRTIASKNKLFNAPNQAIDILKTSSGRKVSSFTYFNVKPNTATRPVSRKRSFEDMLGCFDSTDLQSTFDGSLLEDELLSSKSHVLLLQEHQRAERMEQHHRRLFQHQNWNPNCKLVDCFWLADNSLATVQRSTTNGGDSQDLLLCWNKNTNGEWQVMQKAQRCHGTFRWAKKTKQHCVLATSIDESILLQTFDTKIEKVTLFAKRKPFVEK